MTRKIEKHELGHKMTTHHDEMYIGHGYLWYYLSMLITNAAQLAFYAVPAFTAESPECHFEQIRKNVTVWFDFAFMGGFWLHVAHFAYYSFVDPQHRIVKRNH